MEFLAVFFSPLCNDDVSGVGYRASQWKAEFWKTWLELFVISFGALTWNLVVGSDGQSRCLAKIMIRFIMEG